MWTAASGYGMKSQHPRCAMGYAWRRGAMGRHRCERTPGPSLPVRSAAMRLWIAYA